MNRPASNRRPRLPLIALGLCYTLGLVFVIWVLSGDHPPTADAKIMRLTMFWVACAVMWAMLTAIAILLHRAPAAEVSGWTAWRPAGNVMIILAVAVLMRLVTVCVTDPYFSDDIWRYIHDGQTLAAGRSPYAESPDEVIKRYDNDRQAMPDIDVSTARLVNHPNLVTIYQPTSQWAFASAALISRWVEPDRSTHGKSRTTSIVFRLLFVSFDIWIVALLMLKLLREGVSVWWSVLYGWHPLVLSEVAASGHQDVIGIAWLLMALTLADDQGFIAGGASPRLKMFNRARPVLTGGALALAIGVKPLVAPLVLPLAWSMRRQPKAACAAVLAACVTIAALYLPFAAMEGGLDRMWHTVMTFMDRWSFNNSLHDPLSQTLGSTDLAGMALGVVLFVILIVATLSRTGLWRVSLIYLFAALLLSSTVHPWYLLWALALLPIRFSCGAWVMSLTVAWSYVAILDHSIYVVPGGLLAAEYIPVYALVLWPIAQRLSKKCGAT